MKTPIPLFPCFHCSEDYSKPADELSWSGTIKGWVCDDCWEDEQHGKPVIRLDRELKRQDHSFKTVCEDVMRQLTEGTPDGAKRILIAAGVSDPELAPPETDEQPRPQLPESVMKH